MSNHSSIYQRCVQARLKIGKPGNTRTDKSETQATNMKHGVSNVASVTKRILEDPLRTEIANLTTKAEKLHEDNTLPFDGMDILKSTNYKDYIAKVTPVLRELSGKIEAFCDPNYYEGAINAQAPRMKGLFNREDFYNCDEMKRKLYIDFKIKPLGKLEGFAEVFDDADLVKELQAQGKEEEDKEVKETNKVAWNRLYAVTNHLFEQMKDDNKRLLQSQFDKLKELAELLPKLSPTDDPDLATIAKELKDKVAILDPDDLKYDPENRKKVAETTESILDKMKGFI